MKGDGAHTHHDPGGPGGLGLIVSIAAGLVLTSESILPALLIAVAVIVGLFVLGLITHAVTTWSRWDEVVLLCPDHFPTLPGSGSEQTEMLAMPVTSVDLPVQHQHLHLHGLDPGQVAAILSARQCPSAGGEGEAW